MRFIYCLPSWCQFCCVFAPCVVGVSAVSVHARTQHLDPPIGDQGTLSFQLHSNRAWQNGVAAKKTTMPYLKIAGVADGFIQQNPSAIGFVWRWQNGPRFQTLIPELPGPATWLVQVTWDARAGLCNLFLNGFPITTPGIHYTPWKIAQSVSDVQTFDGPLTVTDLHVVEPRFVSFERAGEHVSDRMHGKHADLFGRVDRSAPLDVTERRGRLIVDHALAAQADVADWVLEGPGQITFQDDWMRMRSTRPDASGDVNGHIVYWCPREIPERFVCEWDVQILSEDGLTIVFFAAKGASGEDLFDPRLPKRDGTFAHYIHGAVNSYHISYYANTPSSPGRILSNLRKNNKFYLLATGPIAIPAGSKTIHHMRLIKDGVHIQLQADDVVSIDYTDPGSQRYGPVYGAGKIGLRQMQWTVARYRNFRVWDLGSLPSPHGL